MSHAAASAALERALELSRELAAEADRGEVRSTASLDAERRQLLQFRSEEHTSERQSPA